MKLNIATPWLIKRKSQAHTARTFRIHDMLIGLAHLQRIVCEHFELDLSLPTNEAILVFADKLNIEVKLEDSFWIPHSNRQKTRHPLTDVVGYFYIRTEDQLQN